MNRLWNRNFALLWQGQLISLLGVQANHIAVMFWVKHATGSATLMGTLMMAAALPAVFLEPLGGVLADRLSRKRIIVWCDFFSGLAMLGVGTLMLLRPEATDFTLVAIFGATALVGSLQAFFRPAITASIPDIVPKDKLAAANSMNQSSLEISLLLGSGIGGILYRLLGAPLLLLFDGLTYLFSAASISFTEIPHHRARPLDETGGAFASIWRELGEGFRYFWRQKGMRTFFLMFAVHSFFLVPCVVMLPFYVEDYLKVSTDWYGYLLACHGVGALVGYTLAGAIAPQGKWRATAMIAAYLVSAFLVGSLGVVSRVGLAMPIVLFMGSLTGFIHVNFVTIVQSHTPSHLRGRLFGIVAVVSTGLSPISMGLTGIVADAVNRDVALMFRWSGIFLSGVILAFSAARSLRDFLSGENEPSLGLIGVSGA